MHNASLGFDTRISSFRLCIRWHLHVLSSYPAFLRTSHAYTACFAYIISHILHTRIQKSSAVASYHHLGILVESQTSDPWRYIVPINKLPSASPYQDTEIELLR